MLSRLLLAILSLKCTSVDADRALRGMTPCERRRWHIDIENVEKPGCSNSWKVPSSWSSNPHVESKMFYESSDECCLELFVNRECNLSDFCECEEKSEDGTCGLEAQQLTATTDDDRQCDDNPKWHLDWDTKEGCTNSPRFPDAWKNDPVVAQNMLFDTSDGCCEKFIQRGTPCTARDVCKRSRKVNNEIKVDEGEFVDVSESTTGNIPVFTRI
mmetsp:Transcript_3549/g.7840  ORF Transcript_3549/g.7840 Transcript_3549/m.7840 type:complete len:214 (-) Transcript_3549:120-761(-)|eukprot:CAMPEP_0172325352 /NCGR_PEP_ID=MMETSP1058-20130122/53802_1 /TAXON_ID=83371 /ORGANISM="Detonula confervacea, Strain CCMP 353" /LENGTH=213 /DNA_ID=CAMNT_0013041875 /DNA_START=176 /DNA_END=817 /DNA_ORIENTATION=+